MIERLPHLEDLRRLVADKGYDADWLVELLAEHEIAAVIPPRSNRLTPREYDKEAYKRRNVVERLFAKAKEFRRVATRYDKLAAMFRATLHLVWVYVALRYS